MEVVTSWCKVKNECVSIHTHLISLQLTPAYYLCERLCNILFCFQWYACNSGVIVGSHQIHLVIVLSQNRIQVQQKPGNQYGCNNCINSTDKQHQVMKGCIDLNRCWMQGVSRRRFMNKSSFREWKWPGRRRKRQEGNNDLANPGLIN